MIYGTLNVLILFGFKLRWLFPSRRLTFPMIILKSNKILNLNCLVKMPIEVVQIPIMWVSVKKVIISFSDLWWQDHPHLQYTVYPHKEKINIKCSGESWTLVIELYNVFAVSSRVSVVLIRGANGQVGSDMSRSKQIT